MGNTIISRSKIIDAVKESKYDFIELIENLVLTNYYDYFADETKDTAIKSLINYSAFKSINGFIFLSDDVCNQELNLSKPNKLYDDFLKILNSEFDNIIIASKEMQELCIEYEINYNLIKEDLKFHFDYTSEGIELLVSLI